jgi:hypothetical protein
MNYRSLPDALHETADHVIVYLREERGLAQVQIETAINADLPKPTIQAITPEFEVICVEPSEEGCYPVGVSRFAEDLRASRLPVRLYVAVSAGKQTAKFEEDLRRAKSQGVGVLSVSPTGKVTVLSDALSLIHANVQPIKRRDYPEDMRNDLHRAEQTYIDGNPGMGCLELQKLIESKCREVASHLSRKGLLTVALTGKQLKGAWATLMKLVQADVKFVSSGVPDALWSAVRGLPPIRNNGAHRATSVVDRQEHDHWLRTRFEQASDLLLQMSKLEKKTR